MKTWLENTYGGIKMTPYQKRRKEQYTAGKLMVPVSLAGEIGPDEERETWSEGGRPVTYVVRDDPEYDPKTPRRPHVVLIDHRDEWASGQTEGRGLKGNLYYHRTLKAHKRDGMIRAESPADVAKLMKMGDDEYAAVEQRFAGRTWPSGADHPPNPAQPKRDKDEATYVDVLSRTQKYLDAVDRHANLGHRADEWGRKLDRLNQRFAALSDVGKDTSAVMRQRATLQARLDSLPVMQAKIGRAVDVRRAKLETSRAKWTNVPAAKRAEVSGKFDPMGDVA